MAQLGQFALALAWVVTAYSSDRDVRVYHDGYGLSGLSFCRQRFLDQIHRGAFQSRSADVFQGQFDLGRPGRVAVVLGLAAHPLLGARDYSELAQAQRDDAVRRCSIDGDIVLLYLDALVHREPLQSNGVSTGGRFAVAVCAARRTGSESAIARCVYGDPPADALSRLRRLCSALRIRDGRNDH